MWVSFVSLKSKSWNVKRSPSLSSLSLSPPIIFWLLFAWFVLFVLLLFDFIVFSLPNDTPALTGRIPVSANKYLKVDALSWTSKCTL